jgi:hypothetical protein
MQSTKGIAGYTEFMWINFKVTKWWRTKQYISSLDWVFFPNDSNKPLLQMP